MAAVSEERRFSVVAYDNRGRTYKTLANLELLSAVTWAVTLRLEGAIVRVRPAFTSAEKRATRKRQDRLILNEMSRKGLV